MKSIFNLLFTNMRICSLKAMKIKRLKHVCAIFIVGACLLISGSAFASFDAIVPSLIEIENNNYIGGSGFGYWGWIVATTETISVTDFQNASFTISINDPNVTVYNHTFLDEGVIAPSLSPSWVAGVSNIFNSASYDPLLVEGETLKDPDYNTFWWTAFEYPNGYDTQGAQRTLTASVIIGTDIVNYTSQVIFTNNGGSDIWIREGQRLSSTVVPEPVSSILFVSGGAALALRRFWKKRKIQITTLTGK